MTTLEIFGVIGIVLGGTVILVIIGLIINYFLNLSYKLEKLEHKLEKLERQGEDTRVHKYESRAKDLALLKRIQKLEQEVYYNENSN